MNACGFGRAAGRCAMSAEGSVPSARAAQPRRLAIAALYRLASRRGRGLSAADGARGAAPRAAWPRRPREARVSRSSAKRRAAAGLVPDALARDARRGRELVERSLARHRARRDRLGDGRLPHGVRRQRLPAARLRRRTAGANQVQTCSSPTARPPVAHRARRHVLDNGAAVTFDDCPRVAPAASRDSRRLPGSGYLPEIADAAPLSASRQCRPLFDRPQPVILSDLSVRPLVVLSRYLVGSAAPTPLCFEMRAHPTRS